MPICTSCTNFTLHLYTVYESANNLRLEQCSKCHSFADPYVEHDSLTLLLDLILLKRGVYRHLLYNRGTEPRRAASATESKEELSTTDGLFRNREKDRWLLIIRLGGALVFLDAFIRWSYLNPNQPPDLSPWTRETFDGVFRVFLGCLAETLAFHLGIIVACFVMLRLISWSRSLRRRNGPSPVSDIEREFRFSLIPLTLLYSSLTKLFLLFLLTIWQPTSTPMLTSRPLSTRNDTTFNRYFMRALEILDDDQMDREWVIRNVLGGMSAGFGLRVILDTHPSLTSIVIIAGWAVKTCVTNLISGWVSRDEVMREAWQAYSIP